MLKKKPIFYDIEHLIKEYPDAQYYVAFGERSNGKTFSALKYAIRRFFKHGEQFAYVRRFGEDVKPKNLKTLFDGHVEHGIIEEYSGGVVDLVNYTASTFVPCKYDESTGKMVSTDVPMGYAFDLSGMEHRKSNSFPRITTIIFDEFLSRQGYLPNEYILFMNTVSTIVRHRKNVKIFMLGNTVNKFCPYFSEMGLSHVKEQKPGTVDVYTYSDTPLKVVVEYCDPMSNRGGKESDIYFAFDNPQLKMITSGSWEISVYPHLTTRYKPKDVMYNFFVEFEDELLHGEIIVSETEYYIFIHQKTTPIQDESQDIVYTDKPNAKWNYRVGFSYQTDELSRLISKMFSENRVFYSDNETGEILRNYILWSNQYSGVKGVT